MGVYPLIRILDTLYSLSAHQLLRSPAFCEVDSERLIEYYFIHIHIFIIFSLAKLYWTSFKYIGDCFIKKILTSKEDSNLV